MEKHERRVFKAFGGGNSLELIAAGNAQVQSDSTDMEGRKHSAGNKTTFAFLQKSECFSSTEIIACFSALSRKFVRKIIAELKNGGAQYYGVSTYDYIRSITPKNLTTGFPAYNPSKGIFAGEQPCQMIQRRQPSKK